MKQQTSATIETILKGRTVTDFSGKTIYVWDSKTGVLAATFTRHDAPITSVTLSPDNQRIVSTGRDKTIQVHTFSQ